MSVRRHLAGTLAVPLVLLPALSVLSGCGDGDGSVADPPVSSPPTSSPTTPERETPEHFIRRWAAAEQAMQNTGDARAYLSLSDGCRACRILAKTVQRYYAHGGFIHWGGWSIRSIKGYPSNGGDSFAVSSLSAPTTYKTSSNAPTRHLKGGTITYILKVTGTPESFHVAAKAQLDE